MENIKHFDYIATHDHENDTELHYKYLDLNNMGFLTLEFHHEDPDVETEAMYYEGEEASLLELVKDMHEEIYCYLDAVRHNGMRRSGSNRPFMDWAGYYEQYTLSSLYAFNNILFDVIKKLEKI